MLLAADNAGITAWHWAV